MDDKISGKADNLSVPPVAASGQEPVSAEALPKKKNHIVIAVVAAAAVLLLAGGAMGYYFAGRHNVPAQLAANKQPGQKAATTNPGNQLQSGDAAYPTSTLPAATSTPVINTAASCKNPLPPIASKSGLVQWLNPELLSTAIFDTNSDPQSVFDHEEDYKVGHILEGTYAGGDILIVKVYYAEPGGPSINYVVHSGSQYFFLTKTGPAYPDLKSSGMKTLVSVVQDSSYFPPDLQNTPGSLHLDSPKADFTLEPASYWNQNFFCADNLTKVFTDPVAGDVYTDATLQVPNAYGSSDQTSQGFYVKAPDGTIDTYQLNIPITGKDNVPLVTWNNGKKNTQEYAFQHIGGCGASNYRDVADVNLSALQQVGSAFDGSPVYEYKNPQTQELQDFYAGIYTPDGQTKITYANFIAGHPIFFWQDPFGKFVRFHNSEFQPMAECGKPVIYLYPPQTEKISVSLDPLGGLTYSEPAYNNGWNVIADPESNITNLADGKVYPYLFWEGRGGLYQTPDKGFVVAEAGVHKFLSDKLGLLGLNGKESADFMAFWEPKMQGAPYYFVTFMGNSVMDSLAPLSVSPKPDTVIRILMDFRPLERPVAAQGYDIKAPARRGFTVVEWGGVLR